MLDDVRYNEEKVFCIGCNKTGTTSLKQALSDLGYRMGPQRSGELLLKEYLARDFMSIVEFCTTADAFQDIPFSLPYTYLILDHYFKNAKHHRLKSNQYIVKPPCPKTSPLIARCRFVDADTTGSRGVFNRVTDATHYDGAKERGITINTSHVEYTSKRCVSTTDGNSNTTAYAYDSLDRHVTTIRARYSDPST